MKILTGGQYSAFLSPRALLQMISFSALGSEETGGILIGHYTLDSNRIAIIEQATRPPPDSIAGPNTFHRGFHGLKELLASYWKQNSYYLGEWHYHPCPYIEPSEDDIKEMVGISKDEEYQCREPIMIIVGTGGVNLRTFVFPRDQELVELK